MRVGLGLLRPGIALPFLATATTIAVRRSQEASLARQSCSAQCVRSGRSDEAACFEDVAQEGVHVREGSRGNIGCSIGSSIR